MESFIQHHTEELSKTKSVPQENSRVEMARTFPEVTIEGFRDYIHNSYAELVFNLDEIGINEWED
jgi:hypothetical protein